MVHTIVDMKNRWIAIGLASMTLAGVLAGCGPAVYHDRYGHPYHHRRWHDEYVYQREDGNWYARRHDNWVHIEADFR